ncbi:MAG: hypothetical protein QOJ80_7306 [Mycobacterium sp.]|jgi:hypothetical protein|nr:hypothetical protein [Mycobacterium sp.]
MTRARTAFGAEFTDAEGFLNSSTYGLPPTFLTDELRDCIGGWIELVDSNNIGNADGTQRVPYGNPYGEVFYLSPP